MAKTTVAIRDWWLGISYWHCVLVYDGPRYLLLFWRAGPEEEAGRG